MHRMASTNTCAVFQDTHTISCQINDPCMGSLCISALLWGANKTDSPYSTSHIPDVLKDVAASARGMVSELQLPFLPTSSDVLSLSAVHTSVPSLYLRSSTCQLDDSVCSHCFSDFLQ